MNQINFEGGQQFEITCFYRYMTGHNTTTWYSKPPPSWMREQELGNSDLDRQTVSHKGGLSEGEPD